MIFFNFYERSLFFAYFTVIVYLFFILHPGEFILGSCLTKLADISDVKTE